MTPEIAAAKADVDVDALGATLNQCDALLGEIGRREHRFGWLRLPGAEDWLPVAAYYPGNRVVVIPETGDERERLCRELVPQHGLYVLTVPPDERVGDPHELRVALERGGWSARPAAEPARKPPSPRPAPPRPASARPAATGGRAGDAGHTRPAATHHPSPPSTAVEVGNRSDEQRFGLLTGFALVAIVWIEAYIGVAVLAFGHGHVVLGFGLVLDACARVLGTIAAAYTGRHEAAWSCLLVGCPEVIAFVYRAPGGPVTTEPAPLAGMVAVVAACVIAFGGLLLFVGG